RSAARWLDAASPEQLAILGAEAQLEASTSARRRDAGGERERPGAEVHRLDLDVVAILRVRDVASSCLAVLHLDAARPGTRLALGADVRIQIRGGVWAL